MSTWCATARSRTDTSAVWARCSAKSPFPGWPTGRATLPRAAPPGRRRSIAEIVRRGRRRARTRHQSAPGQTPEGPRGPGCDRRRSVLCHPRPPAPHDSDAAGDVLVISADGKGIVMRPDAQRPATAKAAAAATNKLACRLSKGEKRNRERLADVLATKAAQTPPAAPRARNKWVTASVVEDAATVIAKVFDQAHRRGPDHVRRWVAIVDGNNHQISATSTESSALIVTGSHRRTPRPSPRWGPCPRRRSAWRCHSP